MRSARGRSTQSTVSSSRTVLSFVPVEALHAKTLGFVHPGTGKWIQFDSQIPEDMTAMIDKWRNYVNFVGTEEDDE